MRPARTSQLIVALAATAWSLGACVSSQHQDGGLPEIDVEDPDPSSEGEQPKFCNPAGKLGDELAKCHALNESLYKEFDEEAKKREPWFNFTPDSWAETPELDPTRVQPVAGAREKDAVSRLEAKPFVELTPAEAEAFAGKAGGAVPAGTKPYLVRALYYYRDAGAFTVYEKNQSILVRHDSVGKETNEEHRGAVVVHLAYQPKDVFVDCGVTE